MKKLAERPLGVTIIAILQLIAALFLIFSGAMGILAGLAIPFFGIFLIAIGAMALIFGIIGFILFIGLWRLKGWAWWLAFIINLITIITSIYSFYMSGFTDYLQLANIIIPLIIVIYLFFVRKHF